MKEVSSPSIRAILATHFSSQKEKKKSPQQNLLTWGSSLGSTVQMGEPKGIYITCSTNRSKGFISYQPYRWGSSFLFDRFHQPPYFQFLNPHPPGTCFKYKRQIRLLPFINPPNVIAPGWGEVLNYQSKLVKKTKIIKQRSQISQEGKIIINIFSDWLLRALHILRCKHSVFTLAGDIFPRLAFSEAHFRKQIRGYFLYISFWNGTYTIRAWSQKSGQAYILIFPTLNK